jgi:hypothetical protein
MLDAAVDRSAAPAHVRERLRAHPASPLRRATIIVYATLLGCALLTPRPVLERLRSVEAGPKLDIADQVLAPLERLCERSDAQALFDSARARFLDGPAPPAEAYRLRAAFDE